MTQSFLQTICFILSLPWQSTLFFNFFGDILNIGFLNGTIGGFIKRLIFVVVTATMVLFSIVMASQLFNGSGKKLLDLGLFTYMVSIANIVMGPVTCFVYMIGTSQEWDIQICPFFLPIGYLIGFLLGVIDGFIGLGNIKFANIFPILIAIVCVIGMFVYRFKVGGAFSGDDYENEETADNIFQARNSYKKQHGSSNYNNSSSYSYSSSNQNADNKKMTNLYFLMS